MTQPSLNDVYGRIGVVEGKVNTVITLLGERVEDQEKRVASLERSRSWLMGAVAVVSAGITALFSDIKGII